MAETREPGSITEPGSSAYGEVERQPLNGWRSMTVTLIALPLGAS